MAVQFEGHRPRLRAVAYRMLGSLTEAEDAVQEAWLRLARSDSGDIDNLGGWLTTVVGRVCLDMLRARRARREESLEDRLPDPVISREDVTDPEQEVLLADSVGLALLVVLESLTPAERLAFVLHDMFGLPFEQIAPIVDRTPVTAKKLASRARRRVRGAAAVAGQAATFQRMATSAATHPALINGLAGLVNTIDDQLISVMSFTIAGGKIATIDILSDLDRLARLGLTRVEP
ncbi:sigma-70 family RNA polymerase sigma factor [Streptosporangium sp. NPDC003464]